MTRITDAVAEWKIPAMWRKVLQIYRDPEILFRFDKYNLRLTVVALAVVVLHRTIDFVLDILGT